MRSDSLIPVAVLTAVVMVACPCETRAADAPRWLLELSKKPAAPDSRDADAVILHDEEHVTVQANGRTITRRLFAVRVQTRAGVRAAAMREVYGRGTEEVRSLKGWVLLDGRVVELGKDHTVDAAVVANDVYNDVRVRVLSAADQVLPGAVFGGESEMAGNTVFSQLEWWLRHSWPVAHWRRVLTLPAGWNVQTATFNHAPIDPVVTGGTRTWSLDRIPAVIEEPAGPPDDGLVPRVAVTYFGSPRGATAFETWEAVGRWLATLQDPSSRPTPALVTKARELTTASSSDLDRLRAIAAYVQKVQYISIQTGLGRGGGYKPHAAADVLQRNYGDCKDKASLMRALLATLNVPSSLVAIYSGDATYVREEWPSPQQFNHAIIAIPVARGTRLPAVLEHESGSTLFFDPTDPFTPLGELPLSLQGSFGLVVSPAGAQLRRLPSTATEVHARERTVQTTISPDGRFSARVRTVARGLLATRERATYQSSPANGYVRALEADVRTRFPGATLTAGPITDDPVGNRFDMEAQLDVRGFNLSAGTLRLLPAVVPLDDLLPKLPPGPRRTAVVLEPRYEQDRFEVILTPAISVDELPPPQTAETAFGRFDVRWTLDGALLARTLTLRVNQIAVAPADYASVRTFIEKFREAERMAAVIAGRRPTATR